ncbi:MAG TPA: hypothetical protein VKD28_00065 [Gemmatimonadales bacterium]|nr:hypothetical protein [Gemmatimonadales bacterium]
MSIRAIALFLHVVGALGLFSALTLEWAALYNLRRADSAGQLRAAGRLLGALRLVGSPAALTLVITGLYLSARWGEQAWIGLGLFGLILIAIVGGALSGRRLGKITREMPIEGAVPAALRARILDPMLVVSAWFRTGLALGVVYLMTTKPGSVIAVTAFSVSAALGLAMGLATRGSRPAPADARLGPAPAP